MDWGDYRKILGISYNDTQLYKLLKNKIVNFLKHSDEFEDFSDDSLFKFCMLTGVSLDKHLYSDTYESIASIFEYETKNVSDIVFYFTALVKSFNGKDSYKRQLITMFQSILKETSINFELLDEQGDYFLLPSGASIFDKELVSEPLLWLNEYPSARKSYVSALKQFSNNDNARDIADNFRKALEEFLHEFFKNTKNLDNNISEVSIYLKSIGGSERITSIYKNILNAYNEINNECVKHHDKIDPMFLEFLMYQTGLFIRMLIVVRKNTGK